jgi:HK97 family phage major capsid protein
MNIQHNARRVSPIALPAISAPRSRFFNDAGDLAGLTQQFERHHNEVKTIGADVAAIHTKLSALEKDVEKHSNSIAGNILGLGNVGSDGKPTARDQAQFRAAVGGYIRTGKEDGFRATMTSDSDPAGGYVVHPVLSNTWTAKIFDASVMRQISRVETIVMGDSWIEPISWDEPDAVWVSENQARPATTTPTIGELRVPVFETYSLQPVSQRLIDDSFIDIGAWLEGKVTDKFGRSESSACVSGDGVSKPRGFLSYPVSTTADATRAYGTLQYIPSGDASLVTADGLRDLFWALRAPHRQNAVWLMSLCNVIGQAPPKSLLFGLEKTGTQQLIDTAGDVLTDDSRLLYGTRGQPAKLKRHLNQLAGAFRNRQTRLALPYSIRGLWKADLFVGYTDSERWVATSVKINPAQLEGAAGLRIGIVPTKQGTSDKVRKDDNKNLVICPLHHDQDFMQTFYEGWRIVQAFIDADANLPKEVALPRPAHREVARILFERREFPVVDVVEAILSFSQPSLLVTDGKQVGTTTLAGQANTNLVIAPLSREPGLFG